MYVVFTKGHGTCSWSLKCLSSKEESSLVPTPPPSLCPLGIGRSFYISIYLSYQNPNTPTHPHTYYRFTLVTSTVSTPCKGWSSITPNANTLGYGQGCLTNKHYSLRPLTGTGVPLLLCCLSLCVDFANLTLYLILKPYKPQRHWGPT